MERSFFELDDFPRGRIAQRSGEYFESDQILFTGLPQHINSVINIMLDSGEIDPGVQIRRVWSLGSRVRENREDDFSDDDLVDGERVDDKGWTVRLYQITQNNSESQADIWGIISLACQTAIDNQLQALPEPNTVITCMPHHTGHGVHGGPHGIFSRIGVLDPDAPFFRRQWAFGQETGIDLFHTEDADPDYRDRSRLGEGIHVAVFDSSPLPTGYYETGTQTAGLEYELYVTAAINEAHPGDSLDDRDPFNQHGYFVASLFQAVAPRAHIHLVQVLDDHVRGGTGFLLAMIDCYLNTYRENLRDEPLILNLSLGYRLHTTGDLADNPEIPDSAMEAFELMSVLARFMAREGFGDSIFGPASAQFDPTLSALPGFALYFFLQKIHELYDSDRILAVAASGNESEGDTERRGMTAPAAYENVLGVAAADDEKELSYFSNPGDVMAPGGDYMVMDLPWVSILVRDIDLLTRGYDRDCPYAIIGRSTTDLIVRRDDQGDGQPLEHIRGLMEGVQHRPAGRRTRSEEPVELEEIEDTAYHDVPSGYLYWMGSSFATPMVSGLAALIWGTNRGLNSDDVRERIENNLTDEVIDVQRAR